MAESKSAANFSPAALSDRKMPGIQEGCDVAERPEHARSTACGPPEAAHRSGFCIGGVSVVVTGARGEDVTLVPSLEPFRIEAGPSDIVIQVEWSASLAPTLRRKIFDSVLVAPSWRMLPPNWSEDLTDYYKKFKTDLDPLFDDENLVDLAFRYFFEVIFEVFV